MVTESLSLRTHKRALKRALMGTAGLAKRSLKSPSHVSSITLAGAGHGPTHRVAWTGDAKL